MGRRAFDNPAKRAWWLVHIEAWRKSGLPTTRYCAQHGLAPPTFREWRRAISDWEERKIKEKQKRKRAGRTPSREVRSKAQQAFWAMHVEVWRWSGLSMRDYAKCHWLSLHSLKRWRDLMDSATEEIDWRAMMHPAARALISTKRSTRTKDSERAKALTAAIEAEAGPPKRARRRRFSTEQKIALLLEAEHHGETISSVGRRHGISTSVLFRWRDQFGIGQDKPMTLAAVRVIDGPGKRGVAGPSLLNGLLPCPEGMKEVELADGRRVFAPADADPDAVRSAVAERETQP